MKATLVQTPPEGAEWIYEVKWDGYRALAAMYGETVRLLYLRKNDLALHFRQIVSAGRSIGADTAMRRRTQYQAAEVQCG